MTKKAVAKLAQNSQKFPQISERMEDFARLMAQGVEVREASRKVGYSDERDGYRLLRHDGVIQAIRQFSYARIASEGVNCSINQVLRVMQDPGTPPSVVLAAADRFFRLAGLDPEHPSLFDGMNVHSSQKTSAGGMDLLNMSITDLESMIAKLQAVASAATPITIEGAVITDSALENDDFW